MYLCSPTLTKISLKNSFGKVLFFFFLKFWLHDFVGEMQIYSLDAILKRWIFKDFLAELQLS